MRDVYIVEAVRTPIGKMRKGSQAWLLKEGIKQLRQGKKARSFGVEIRPQDLVGLLFLEMTKSVRKGKKGGKSSGILAKIRPDDLAALILKALVERARIEPARVEDVILGCVDQLGEQGANIARMGALLAGFPIEVPGTSVNRACASSQQAIHFAAQAISSGDMDLVIAGGVESMSHVPIISDILHTQSPVAAWSPNPNYRYELVYQHKSAEMVAKRWQISREELDLFSHESHRRAAKATRDGYFNHEIVPIETKKGLITADEGIRLDPNLTQMAKLEPVLGLTLITAGNSSQESDGAAVLLLASEQAVKEFSLKPRARIVARAVVGTDPTLMLDGPIPATRKVLKMAGLSLSDIDLFEVNEAFASVPLAWSKELGVDLGRLNVNGGAIALGHPLGATGARIMTTLLHELERRKARYGLETICIGFGMATATIIERIS